MHLFASFGAERKGFACGRGTSPDAPFEFISVLKREVSPAGDLLFPRRKSRQNAVGGRCGVNLGIHLDLHSAYPRTPVYEGIEQSHFCTNPALLSVALSASDAPLPLKCVSLRALALFVMQRAWCGGTVLVRLSPGARRSQQPRHRRHKAPSVSQRSRQRFGKNQRQRRKRERQS